MTPRQNLGALCSYLGLTLVPSGRPLASQALLLLICTLEMVPVGTRLWPQLPPATIPKLFPLPALLVIGTGRQTWW